MFRLLMTAGLVLLAIVSLAGCQAHPQISRSESGRKTRSALSDESAYYFFSAAQFELRQGDLDAAISMLEQAVEHDSGSTYLKLEMAGLLTSKNELDRALELIEKVILREPDNMRAIAMAGRIYEQQNKLDRALDAYEKVLAADPRDESAYLRAGRIHWNRDDLDNARQVFKRMTQHVPGSYAAFYFYGKVLASQGEQAAAEAALVQSLKLEPSLKEALLELAKLYKSQNRTTELIQIYRNLLIYHPGRHKYAFELALHLRKIGQERPALELLAWLARRIDKDATIFTTLFAICLESKQYQETLWITESMLRANPAGRDLHFLAGVAAESLGDNKSAIEHQTQVSPDSRLYTDAVVRGALLYHDMGKSESAIKLVRKAQVYHPDYIDFYFYLGYFYEKLERYDQALGVLQAGVSKDANEARLHFRMGVIYDKLGRRQESIKAMQEVLRLTPDDAQALNYLGYTYADMGIKLDEAETLIQSALRIKPDDGYIADSLGWVYYKRGQYDEALQWLNKALSIQPNDPTILEHLGDLYLKLESTHKALNYYQRSLTKKESGREALREKIRSLKVQ